MSDVISLSSAQQAALDNFVKQQQALLAERAKLETERLTLDKQAGSLSTAQKTRLTEINSRLDQISAESLALTKQEETAALPDKNAAVKQAAKETLVQQVTAAIPPPPKGSYNIVHTAVAAGDIISYIKFTQHLNPYGRKRQCDSDLENLMAVINKDINNKLAEHKQTALEIAKAAASSE